MSEKELALTGLPRHDRLWSMPKTPTTVLVMPTWRKFLLAANKRKPIASFAELDYVRHWHSLLHSAELRSLVEEYGLKLAFCPHAAMAPFIGRFALPDFCEVIDPLAEPSLHPLFARTALLVTDYSSVAFELAYIERPVIYYQFDAKAFYEGGHLGFAGYFDFARDGFGPVCETEDAVCSAPRRRRFPGPSTQVLRSAVAQPSCIVMENVVAARMKASSNWMHHCRVF